jgi:hypothetical protein
VVTRAGRARVLVGVDGGATGVRAHSVAVSAEGTFALAGASCEEDYEVTPGFEPLPLEEQAAQLAAPRPGELEREQAERWVAAVAGCIAAVARGLDEPPLVGIGMPGLKTVDGRGLAVVRNGPRIPDFLDRLEVQLAALGATSRAAGCLFGDGQCCGLGEEHARAGLLGGVRDGYYVASGTGVAEALKLDGALVSLDDAGAWFPKAWQLEEGGRSVEAGLSIAAMNRDWLVRTERPQPLRSAWPEDHTDEDVLAVAALTNLGTAFARLVHRRVVQLGERGGALQRVVIGQRLGQLWSDERALPFLARTAERELARLLVLQTREEIAAPYLDRRSGTFGTVRDGLLVASELRAAPALGAAVAAVSSAGSPGSPGSPGGLDA